MFLDRANVGVVESELLYAEAYTLLNSVDIKSNCICGHGKIIMQDCELNINFSF
jgi:hypothetical protein